MKQILTILLILMFYGCDFAPTEHTHNEFEHTHNGVCVNFATLFYQNQPDVTTIWRCFARNELECIQMETGDAKFSWITEFEDCEEFCNDSEVLELRDEFLYLHSYLL